ncbi:hypothetical protein HanRHA438_Chr03g0109501 [Helianthus annuus]|nr:hypothetical protein HanRHA438_Chr03g0109501 [Helianthus annuus]
MNGGKQWFSMDNRGAMALVLGFDAGDDDVDVIGSSNGGGVVPITIVVSSDLGYSGQTPPMLW